MSSVEEILGMVAEAEGFRPVVRAAISVLKSYGPELYGLMESLNNGTVDLKIAAIKRYQTAGFSKEEAISLVMDEWYQIKKSIQNASYKGGK